MAHEGKDEYEILPYAPEFRSGVLDVLTYLLGSDHEKNSDYFTWKHENNPYSDGPLGVVVLCKSQVVGFRAFLATRWRTGRRGEEITVLCPGDTVVHPDHRRKNLSVLMGKRAMEEYAPTYRVFLNLSAGANSVPGYLRMGFVPLTDKIHMMKYSRWGLVKTLLTRKGLMQSGLERITFGASGSLLVSEQPMPAEMSRIVSMQEISRKRLTLVQDEAFFQRRFRNNRKKYIFYYLVKDGAITAYVVISAVQSGWQGLILDFAETERGSLESILREVIRMSHFNALSVFRFSPRQPLANSFKRIGFKVHTLRRTIRKMQAGFPGEWPILVRPVKPLHEESDWIVQGLDIRRAQNWDIKGICSDGA